VRVLVGVYVGVAVGVLVAGGGVVQEVHEAVVPSPSTSEQK
jgi:hypothetical protein